MTDPVIATDPATPDTATITGPDAAITVERTAADGAVKYRYSGTSPHLDDGQTVISTLLDADTAAAVIGTTPQQLQAASAAAVSGLGAARDWSAEIAVNQAQAAPAPADQQPALEPVADHPRQTPDYVARHTTTTAHRLPPPTTSQAAARTRVDMAAVRDRLASLDGVGAGHDDRYGASRPQPGTPSQHGPSW